MPKLSSSSSLRAKNDVYSVTPYIEHWKLYSYKILLVTSYLGQDLLTAYHANE